MGVIFHQEVDCRVRHDRSTSGHRSLRLAYAMLCAVCIFQLASEARAQCAARDVLQNHLTLKKAPSAGVPQVPVRSAADVPTWKTIALGTFVDSFALRNALDKKGCGVGGLAAEILARPAFVVGSTKTDVELVAVSAVEIGFSAEVVNLAAIYARAQLFGFELAAAEVGPQLRLQYLDQPMGEFLIIGMEPIKTWSGEPVILNVANGGAGLILIGQDGRPDAEIAAISRIVFVRPNRSVPADELAKAAALPPP
ncbi:hypothetical protein ABIG06_001941 [Bradyrhizobium sp. USDA 326]|uniref:hypothetical protein n=1 Tax=unclassified Bradyrhizobium TaxID=2631580 RepID=UPI003511335F